MVRILITARNIYNQDDIKEYLKSIEGNNSKINRWINSNLRNYLINHYPDVLKVKKAKTDDPQWVKNSIKKGDLEEINFKSRKWGDFKQDIEHAFGYLLTLNDPSRTSVPDAIRNGNRLIEDQNKKASDEESSEDVKKVFTFSNKYFIVEMLTMQSLKREGKLMGHCTGQENQRYYKDIKRGEIRLFSLRDPFNKPHCTIEYDVKHKKIQQIKGKQNKGVVKKYQPYVAKFLQYAKQKNLIDRFEKNELINIGILEIEDVWYDINNIPKYLKVSGDLDFSHTDITSLPEGFEVGGDLYLSNTKITSLPKGLKVGGYLDLSHTDITSLPEGLKVKDLYLKSTKITSLPEGLEVGGDLYLKSTKITSLPKGLKAGSLYLYNTKITSLPKGLKVGGYLDLSRTKVTSLPEGLEVGGYLNLSHTDITSLPEGLKAGSLYLYNTKITSLPEGLKVKDLYLKSTKITSLPKGLKVGGYLNLSHTDITSLPEDLHVGGDLDLSHTNITSLPKGLKVKGEIIG